LKFGRTLWTSLCYHPLAGARTFRWPRPLPSAPATFQARKDKLTTTTATREELTDAVKGACGRYPSGVWLTTLWHLAFSLNLLSSLRGLTLARDDALL
jgi:hypothetical protein